MAALKNQKHERFAQGLAKGKSQIEAYAEAGYKADPGAASRLSRNVKVTARVAELQERGALRVEFDLAEAARQLDEDRALAHRVKQPGAAVSATLGKAKLFGLLTDKVEHSGAKDKPVIVELIGGP